MSGYLVFTVGLPGSGKTSFARKFVENRPKGTAIAVSRDGLRDEYFGTREGLTGEQEVEITALQHSQIHKALERGLSVVVHDCNLRMRYRRQLAQIAENTGSAWFQFDLSTMPLEECLRRNEARSVNQVPMTVIMEMHERYIKPNKGGPMPMPVTKPKAVLPRREMYSPDFSKKKAILVDIDGTVAIHEGVRGPYDTSKYHLDKPNLPVIKLVQEHAYNMDYDIIFCSGRHEDFRSVTEEWLYEHVKVPIAGLYMRQNHGTNDAIEKLDLFDEHIRNGPWCVRFSLDDRDRVVAAWRSIGLTCLQVAPGDF